MSRVNARIAVRLVFGLLLSTAVAAQQTTALAAPTAAGGSGD